MGYKNSLEHFKALQEQCFEIFEAKNNDYGDSFRESGLVGLIVRMHDKLARILNVSKTQITLVESEQLRDTLIDLANYALLAVMVLDEE